MAYPRGISGNQGSVNAGSSNLAELTKWTFRKTLGIQTYVPQSGVIGGVGYQKTVQGNTKATGTLEGKFDPNAATPISSLIASGALLTLILYSVKPTAYRSFGARISDFATEADIDGGTIQPFTATYESDLNITEVGV